jgi:hypothetical protein
MGVFTLHGTPILGLLTPSIMAVSEGVDIGAGEVFEVAAFAGEVFEVAAAAVDDCGGQCNARSTPSH